MGKDDALQDGAEILDWLFPMNEPDLLYYQCIMHAFLGWMLVFFQEGALKVNRLVLEIGGVSLNSECLVKFKKEELQFFRLELGLSRGLDLYWTPREDDREIRPVSMVHFNILYVDWACGYLQMSWGNSSIAFEGPNLA